MCLRGMLFATSASLVLLTALYASGPIPDPRIFPNDASGVGKRTTRKEQQPGHFREYPAWEYNNFPIPPDFNVPGEWVFARFMYRAVPTWRGFPLNNWTQMYSA